MFTIFPRQVLLNIRLPLNISGHPIGLADTDRLVRNTNQSPSRLQCEPLTLATLVQGSALTRNNDITGWLLHMEERISLNQDVKITRKQTRSDYFRFNHSVVSWHSRGCQETGPDQSQKEVNNYKYEKKSYIR
jgi:hypothetical protein